MDLLITNARVVDGTGNPSRIADVAVSKGIITAVGTLEPEPGTEVVDAGGRVLTPGFIDVHTHYDAQVFWDQDLTPSPWHGVTTVVMGNCGFGIAPTRPEHRTTIARTLENVEGMDFEALSVGIPWNFETYPQYLDALEALPFRIDVASMLGHTPLRIYVMGADATERAATPEEIDRMRALVGEAMASGAVGFSTSNANGHSGDGGKPVPSRFADHEEFLTLAAELRHHDHGVVMVASGAGLFIDEAAELSRASGRPVTWAALFSGVGRTGTAADLVARSEAADGDVWPQISCRPVVMQMTLEDPFPFARVKEFEQMLALPRDQRTGLYRDLAWRDVVRPGVEKQWGHQWGKTVVAESEVHAHLVDGPSIAALAAEAGQDPFDYVCDLSLQENLKTRFRLVMFNDDEDEVGQLLQDPRTLLGLSDAGAHVSQLCDACYSTHLLGHWVRERGTLTLEQAVWRLSGQPAEIFGFADRGVIEPGRRADLVLLDPATVATGPLERVWDQPAGSDRLVARGEGVSDTWVAGVAIRRDGTDLEARPGRLVRAGKG